MYNKTQLDPDKTFERHVFHRDQFAHYLRWTYVLKIAKPGFNILDFGCGSGNLAEVLYRNRYTAKEYLGLDIRQLTINNNIGKFINVPWIKFIKQDLVEDSQVWTPKDGNWDIIASFEVIEHIGKNNIYSFIKHVKNHMSKDTLFLLSSPCYDSKIGAANNHMINGQVGEFTYDEIKNILSNEFDIIEHYGTFASQKDYKPYMNEHQKYMFNELSKYYDSNLISNIFAPMFPEHSKNCLWVLKLKGDNNGI